jgi:hypothetical protein
MKQASVPGAGVKRPPAHRRSVGPAVRLGLLIGSGVLIAYLLWPFAALWQLDRAVRAADMDALADRIDLNAVRDELKRKLNKEAASSIDTLSDPFIRWLEDGIQRMGNEAVESLVTLEWVRERLLAPGADTPDAGFLRQIAGAYFDSPRALRLVVGKNSEHPVKVRLSLVGLTWQVTTVYY